MERLTNSLMMKGRNNGKKLMAMRIVKHAFEIIYLLSDTNPLQVSNETHTQYGNEKYRVHARTMHTTLPVVWRRNPGQH